MILALAAITDSERVRRVVLVLSGAAMTTYATLTFLALYVP